MKKDSKEESKSFLKGLTIETIKDIEKIFQGIGSIFKNIWNFLTNPSRILKLFRLENLDLMYDKFLKNEKLMKALAFIVALLFVISTRYTPNQSDIRPSATIPNHPLTVYTNPNYVIVDSGIPETVSVVLSGDRTQVELAQTRGNFEIYADLRNLSEGVHQVDLKYTNISNRIDVSINPSTIAVTIAELVEEEFQVEADFMNRKELEEWYVLGTPTLSVDTVRVRGAKSIVDEIASIRALIDVSNLEELSVYEAPVVAFDSTGHRLNVDIIPSTVTASVEVMKKSEIVPFRVSITGNPPEGLSISKVIVEPEEIELFGERPALDLINFFPVSVDLYQLNEDNEIWVDLEYPDGIQAMSEDRIKVTIIYEETETKTLNDVVINLRNLELGYEITPLSSEDTMVDVTLMGASSLLSQISESHINVFIDLANLEEGEHEVRIGIDTPEFIIGELGKRNVRINITK